MVAFTSTWPGQAALGPGASATSDRTFPTWHAHPKAWENPIQAFLPQIVGWISPHPEADSVEWEVLRDPGESAERSFGALKMKWGFAMPCEVEVKFPVADPATIRRQLNALGCQWDNHTIEEVDRYFQHPARDFSQTDEALRLRRSDRALAFLTYKGPKIDPGTKTRDEIELPIDPTPEAFAAWQNLLERLGFRPVADVRKKRHRAKVQWQDWVIQVSLDDVESLGWYLGVGNDSFTGSWWNRPNKLVLSLAARPRSWSGRATKLFGVVTDKPFR